MYCPGFDTVLVDEACQSSEVGTLLPLAYGARRCILVGDPQQLGATVMSGASALKRSLFERLQAAGCKVLLLDTQYRMHRSIGEFPLKRFYQLKAMSYTSQVVGCKFFKLRF